MIREMFAGLPDRALCRRSVKRGLTLALVLACAWPAGAQTRQEEARKKREEKSRALAPYQPGKIEEGLLLLEERGYIARLFNPPNGFFPQFGNLTPGAGIAVGVGYRANRVLGGRSDMLATFSISHRRYVKAEFTARLPRLANNRLFVEGTVHLSDFPEIRFHGLGPDSPPDARTSFDLRTNSISAGAGVRVRPWLVLGERVSYVSPKVGPGRRDEFPSIERLFDDGAAPGLDAQPNFLQSDTYLDLDYRQPGPNASTGGRYYASYSFMSDRRDGTFSFDRWDVDLQQYVSILDGHRTFVVRGLMASTAPVADGRVPFYLQPWLGGSHMLRSVPSFRFRDRHLLLLQAEYRWRILSFLSGALFYDRGMVAPTLSALRWDRMSDDYGIGLRFGGPAGVFVRTDLALGGDEGTRFLFRFNHVF